MNWIIPRKLLAFATPFETGVLPGNWRAATPRDLVPVFKSAGVTTIVRLSQPLYDPTVFKKAGFKFHEMFFADGSAPCDSIREAFLDLCESPEVIAVHSKAGLGRAGTLAACFLIEHFGMTANEAIGWVRMCRPGSVIGPQQAYLAGYEAESRSGLFESRPKPRPQSAATVWSQNARSPAQDPVEQTRGRSSLGPPARIDPPPKTRKSVEAPLRVQGVCIGQFYPQPRKYRSSSRLQASGDGTERDVMRHGRTLT
jgi:cell division cycle 14